MSRQWDVAVVGGGIVGLAHAWLAARRGLSVLLFDRDPRPQGASIRNFGMIWPIGQTPGEMHQRALRSRELWLELARQAGFWVNACGSLHLAYQTDEFAVLEEFAGQGAGLGFSCQLLTPAETLRRSPAVLPNGLLGALWSPTELCVDPRQAITTIPDYLSRAYPVEVHFGTAVTAVEPPEVHAADGRTWHAEQVIVAGGIEFQTLFPEVFADSGIRRCKLQMMRTVPQPAGWALGPHLASGLTLCHYPTFRVCPSLPRLRQRIEEELPQFVHYGIHVMASQNHLGEVVIGDSHEYDEAIEPFDKTAIDQLILDYLRGMVQLPDWTIAGRWHGLYGKHPSLPVFTVQPRPGVTIMTATGGAGMTLSLGQAEHWWQTVAG